MSADAPLSQKQKAWRRFVHKMIETDASVSGGRRVYLQSAVLPSVNFKAGMAAVENSLALFLLMYAYLQAQFLCICFEMKFPVLCVRFGVNSSTRRQPLSEFC